MKKKTVFIGMTLALGLSQYALANYNDEISRGALSSEERQEEALDSDRWHDNERFYDENHVDEQQREAARPDSMGGETMGTEQNMDQPVDQSYESDRSIDTIDSQPYED